MDSADFSSENYTTTPLKSEGSSGNSSRRLIGDRSSSSQYRTPVRCNESIIKRSKVPKSNSFKKMPIYSPPTNVVGHVKNPFEHARFLKERLSQPFCSPSLFEKIVSPAKDDQLTWSIEDISVLRPAPINENPSQEFDSWFSPATENEAQKAINKFFSSQIVNMESPVDVRQNGFKNDNSGKTKIETTETWSQTILTFPSNLTPELEKQLSKYYTFIDNQFNQNSDDLNSFNDSISRKKLSFDSETEDEESVCSTPIQISNKCMKQTIASTPISTVLTSPELSPITMDKKEASPMDVSMSFQSNTRLSLVTDVKMNEKENLQLMSWKYNSIDSAQSADSAVSPVE